MHGTYLKRLNMYFQEQTKLLILKYYRKYLQHWFIIYINSVHMSLLGPRKKTHCWHFVEEKSLSSIAAGKPHKKINFKGLIKTISKKNPAHKNSHPSKTSWWLNHPFEKYARQNGSFPQIGLKINKYLKPPPRT